MNLRNNMARSGKKTRPGGKKMNLRNIMTRTVKARNDCRSKWENLVLGRGRNGLKRRFGRERCQTAATAKGG